MDSSNNNTSNITSSKPKILADYTKMEDDYGRDIDHLVKEGTLSIEQFQTYSRTYCWYCGRPYVAVDGKRHIRIRTLNKKETESTAVKKVTTTYSRTIKIPECSECKAYHAINDKSINHQGNLALIIGYSMVAALLIYLCNSTGETATVLIIGIFASLALYMVVAVLGMLVLWPFKTIYDAITHEKEKNPQPTLRSEEDLPMIRDAHEDGFY